MNLYTGFTPMRKKNTGAVKSNSKLENNWISGE